MLRTCIFYLCLFGLAIPAQGDVEIYSSGHRYGSMQDYQQAKSNSIQSALEPVPLNRQQQDDLRKDALKMGLNVDLSKAKTLVVNKGKLSPVVSHKWYVLGFENGVVAALKGFYENRQQGAVEIPAGTPKEKLQDIIKQAVTASKGPKLLISQPGKMRIMSMKQDIRTK